jgi:hypothetical protein
LKLSQESAVIDLHGERIYKRHRIHVCRLVSGQYAAVVRFGAKGSSVENVAGKYRSRDEAVAAARDYIDQAEEKGEALSS